MSNPRQLCPPLVPIAAALLIGAACGGARPAPEPVAAAALACVASAVAARRRGGLALALAILAAAGAGAALAGWSWRDASRRLDTAFDGERALERTIDARVTSAAERDRDGRRWLLVETGAGGPVPKLRLRLEIPVGGEAEARRIDALRRGDTIRAWCRLRNPDEAARRRLAAQRVDATARAKSSRLITRVAAGRGSAGRVIDEGKVRARAALDRTLGETGEARAVLAAMLLGDRLLLDDDTNRLLRDAGLVHILSISGLHTAITILLLLSLLRRSGLGASGLVVAGGFAMLAFCAFVGHGAPVWRSAASIGVGLVARLLGREVDPLSALALAAALLVAACPPLAWNIGFVLSVVATAGLFGACPAAAPGAKRPSGLKRSMAASCGAYLATAPLLAAWFGRLAPAGLIANLAAAPLCAACLAAGAAAIACAGIPFAAPLAATAAEGSVTALLAVSRWAASIPGGHFRVAAPGVTVAAGYTALLIAVWLFRDAASRTFRRAIGLAFAGFLIALHVGPAPSPGGAATIRVLDVGQGLAVILQGGDGRVALVDAGPTGGGRFDAGDRIVVPALSALGCRRLSILALSHDHDDHAGGARSVLLDLEVGELWVAAGTERDPLTARLVELAVSRGTAVRRLKRGDCGMTGALGLSVLHPGLEDRDRPVNDRCLVLRATLGRSASILLPGDLESGGERTLLARGAVRESAALVAGHHGADGSSTHEFLRATAPRCVVISAGRENRFGHPGPAALSRFDAIGARVYRTDREGALTLIASGTGWLVSGEDERRGDEGQKEQDQERDRDQDPGAP